MELLAISILCRAWKEEAMNMCVYVYIVSVILKLLNLHI